VLWKKRGCRVQRSVEVKGVLQCFSRVTMWQVEVLLAVSNGWCWGIGLQHVGVRTIVAHVEDPSAAKVQCVRSHDNLARLGNIVIILILPHPTFPLQVAPFRIICRKSCAKNAKCAYACPSRS